MSSFIYDLRYENLIDSQELEVKKLLEFQSKNDILLFNSGTQHTHNVIFNKYEQYFLEYIKKFN